MILAGDRFVRAPVARGLPSRLLRGLVPGLAAASEAGGKDHDQHDERHEDGHGDEPPPAHLPAPDGGGAPARVALLGPVWPVEHERPRLPAVLPYDGTYGSTPRGTASGSEPA